MLQVLGGLLLQTATVIQIENGLSLKKEIDFCFSSTLVRTRIWQKPSSWSSRVGFTEGQWLPSSPPVTLSPVPRSLCSPSHSLTLKERGGAIWSWKMGVPRILQGQHALTFLLISAKSACSKLSFSSGWFPVAASMKIIPSLHLSLTPSPKCPWRMGLSGSYSRLRHYT